MVSESIRASYGSEKGFFASRYKQGTRTVYGIAMTPDQITGLVKRPDPAVESPGNRMIALDHAKGFAQYFIDNDHWVVPGLILRAPNIFQFEQSDEVPDLQFGTVTYSARNEGDIQILDGQHRILGFHLAIEMLGERAEVLRTKKANARRMDDVADVRSIDADLRRIEKVRDRFSKERVTVEIQVVDDLNAYRQMFYDIAENAKGITASVKARFDTTKVVNRALAHVAEDPRLVPLIDRQLDRLSAKSKYWLAMRTLMEITRTVAVGFDGRVTPARNKTLGEAEIAKNAKEFFDVLFDSFPQLQNMLTGQLTSEMLRKHSMLGSPLFVRVLAGVFYELRSDAHHWSSEMVANLFKSLAPHVVDPAHENSIWKTHASPEAFHLGAWGPNGRRQDAKGLVMSIVGWGVDDEKFLQEPPLDPPSAPVDPDVGIDFAPTHSTKALEVEERNAIDQIAADAKARAQRIKKTPAPKRVVKAQKEGEPEKVAVHT